MAARGSGRNRRTKNTVTTKSGKTLKINSTMGDRLKSRHLARASAKAAYLSTLPKDRWKRILARMHPKRVAEYWFSREGAIMALKVIGAGIVVVFFLTIGMFAYFRKDLPKIKDIAGTDFGGSITYYDRTGKTVLWQDYDAVKRLPVQSSDINPYIKDATVAIEDKDFYKHGAFDVRGIMRAGAHDVFGGGGAVQGGSTITQQLVKLNEQWTDNRTITRKVKELILAVELEREYSKDDILTGYLNIAPYGGVEYGVQSAAEDYFHTSAKDLTLPEAAMLAAIPQSPSYYSPYAATKYNPAVTNDTFSSTALLNRQHYILDLMAQQGYITKAQADAAKQVDVLALIQPQQNKYQGITAPYFVLAAKQQLNQTYGASTVQRGGWKVITTLDLGLQQKAESLVASNLPHVARYGADEEAMVGEDVPTGQIVMLVGGTDFNNPDHGQDNYAAEIKIPPGSSFKPYDYTTLVNNNNNVGASSVMYDQLGPIPGYPCTNKALPTNGGNCLEDYDFRSPGPVTLRYALGGSRNIPAVKAMLEAVPNDNSSGHVNSINKVISTASSMMDNTYDQAHNQSSYNCYSDAGLTQTAQCYGASAIGDGAYLHLDDHVNGLSTLGREGVAIPRTFIMNITDASGKQIYKWTQPKGTQVVKQDAAYVVDSMASDPRASYLPGNCSATSCTPLSAGGYKFHRYDGWQLAVKTGTTNDNYDGLMTSWSTKYAVVSWVGNHTRQVALKTYMEVLTEPLTRPWMEYALSTAGKPVNWTQPTDIKTASSFVQTAHIDNGDQEPGPATDIYPSWYAGGSKASSSATIDKVSGLLATSCTPALAKQTTYNGNAASWNIDIFVNNGHPSVGSTSTSNQSSSTAATDNVHNCNDSPPQITLTATDCGPGTCTFTASVTAGTHPLSDPNYPQFPGTINFTVNGQTVCSRQIPEGQSVDTETCNYQPTSSGSAAVGASVTDSVLYSASTQQTVNFTIPTQTTTTTITNFKGTRDGSGNNINFSWNGGSPNYSVYFGSSPVSGCQNVTSTACTGTGVIAYHGTFTLKDSAGNSSTATVN